MTADRWIASRARAFDSSGIRKVFDLAATLKNPVNLSIGQPDFDVPERVQKAAIEAIRSGKNGYAPTQGIPALREKLQQRIREEYRHTDRNVFVASGTSGALVLAMLALVNPGDEVMIFDPYFVMYPSLVDLVGGSKIFVSTYPDFRIDIDRVRASLTDRTKMILFNSPANPTGHVASTDEVRELAQLAADRGIALVSDEIYRAYCFDGEFVSPSRFNEQTIVIDGFSKSHGMTGWRLGFAHGPAAVIDAMVKIQQFTFVCAPQPAQWAGAVAMDVPIDDAIAAYRKKRDRVVEGLSDKFEIARPGGAFYVFPKVPHGTGAQFVRRAIERELLIIPGNVFSRQDTHFRVSYAASDETIERGIAILRSLA